MSDTEPVITASFVIEGVFHFAGRTDRPIVTRSAEDAAAAFDRGEVFKEGDTIFSGLRSARVVGTPAREEGDPRQYTLHLQGIEVSELTVGQTWTTDRATAG